MYVMCLLLFHDDPYTKLWRRWKAARDAGPRASGIVFSASACISASLKFGRHMPRMLMVCSQNTSKLLSSPLVHKWLRRSRLRAGRLKSLALGP